MNGIVIIAVIAYIQAENIGFPKIKYRFVKVLARASPILLTYNKIINSIEPKCMQINLRIMYITYP